MRFTKNKKLRHKKKKLLAQIKLVLTTGFNMFFIEREKKG